MCTKEKQIYKSYKKKEKILLYVGSRLKYKNFDNLLKAISLNNGFFKLICFGEESLSIKEKYLIENLKLNKKNIIFDSGMTIN